jgi:hypothetical protein
MTFAELLLSDGAFVRIALVAIAIEGLVLLALAGAGRIAASPLDLAGQLGAGAALLLAVDLAIHGVHPGWIALLVTLSLPAHAFDLRRRLGRARRDAVVDARR